jgi:hypothetical protein
MSTYIGIGKLIVLQTVRWESELFRNLNFRVVSGNSHDDKHCLMK